MLTLCQTLRCSWLLLSLCLASFNFLSDAFLRLLVTHGGVRRTLAGLRYRILKPVSVFGSGLFLFFLQFRALLYLLAAQLSG